MPTNRELLLSLRDGFEQLELFDRVELNSLRNRGQMYIRRVFGPDSPYIERLSSIEFRYMGIAVGTLEDGESPATRRARQRAWLSGQKEAVTLVDTMLEDLELGELDQVRTGDEQTRPISNRVFVVHGHDREMKQMVARTLERLRLEAVILHEKPNRGQTLIENIERYSDVDFAVVLLSPDDMGYAVTDGQEAASPRARQDVILELGYFVGKLGRERVVALYRRGIEFPSDYDGVLYTPYDSDSGTWRSELVADLKESGYEVSADSL